MLYVANRPLSSVASRRPLLVGSFVFFVLNMALTEGTLISDSSTAVIGLLYSVPLLVGVAVVTAVQIKSKKSSKM
jgi:hypothetical protein